MNTKTEEDHWWDRILPGGDAHKTDYTAMSVFADWLEDRSDPRAFGYREIARLRIYPNRDNYALVWTWFACGANKAYEYMLPYKLMKRLEGGICVKRHSRLDCSEKEWFNWRDYETPREAFDAAALALAEPKEVPARAPEKARKVRKPRARRK